MLLGKHGQSWLFMCINDSDIQLNGSTPISVDTSKQLYVRMSNVYHFIHSD